MDVFVESNISFRVCWVVQLQQLLLVRFGTSLIGASQNSGGGFGIGVLIGFAALIGGIWFTIAQDVKRLHDVDKSGWLVILLLIPIVNFILGLYMLLVDGTVVRIVMATTQRIVCHIVLNLHL